MKPTHWLRALYFSLGAGAAVGTYAAVQRSVWRGTADVARAHGTMAPPKNEQPEPLFGPAVRANIARGWNKAVDSTLGALARELGKRGI